MERNLNRKAENVLSLPPKCPPITLGASYIVSRYICSRDCGLQGQRDRKNMARPVVTALAQRYSESSQTKLRMLNNARTLDDLRIPPANRLEALKGNRKGPHSTGSMINGACASSGTTEM